MKLSSPYLPDGCPDPDSPNFCEQDEWGSDAELVPVDLPPRTQAEVIQARIFQAQSALCKFPNHPVFRADLERAQKQLEAIYAHL